MKDPAMATRCQHQARISAFPVRNFPLLTPLFLTLHLCKQIMLSFSSMYQAQTIHYESVGVHGKMLTPVHLYRPKRSLGDLEKPCLHSVQFHMRHVYIGISPVALLTLLFQTPSTARQIRSDPHPHLLTEHLGPRRQTDLNE